MANVAGNAADAGYFGRRRSLVDDTKFTTARNKEIEEGCVKELTIEVASDLDLTPEEVLLVSQLYDKASPQTNEVSLLFSMHDMASMIPGILKQVEMCSGQVLHLETRRQVQGGADSSLDLLLQLDIKRDGLLNLVKSIRNGSRATVTLCGNGAMRFKNAWFPHHVSDLDSCTHILSTFEPELDSGHPGFSDPVYRARRKEIAEIAFHYKQGDSIPKVEYTAEEIKTWGGIFSQLRSLNEAHACASYLKVFRILEQECEYGAENIPQLQEVSNFLKKRTGFTLRPAAGLLTARDFLASLAFRVFQCTQYVRHSNSPNHSPEPDCIHELLGHVPNFADPDFARFSQELGLASLGATDEEIEKLSTVYWFTVEFGLCRENGKIKAYGAGLLSSYGELLHALSEAPTLLPFDPEVTAMQPYQDHDYQDVYFVAESFEDAKEKIRHYVNTKLHRKYEVMYHPFTDTVYELDSYEKLEFLIDSIKSDVSQLSNAVHKLKRAM